MNTLNERLSQLFEDFIKVRTFEKSPNELQLSMLQKRAIELALEFRQVRDSKMMTLLTSMLKILIEIS